MIQKWVGGFEENMVRTLKEGPAPRAQKGVGYFLSEMPLAPELYAIWFALKDPDVSTARKVAFLSGSVGVGGGVGGAIGAGAGSLVPVLGSGAGAVAGGTVGTALALYSSLVDKKHQNQARSYLGRGGWHPILEAQQSAARKALANPSELTGVLAWLNALHWTALAAHWKVKGSYGDHLLYERIAKSYYEQMDPLAERVIGREPFDEVQVGVSAVELIRKYQTIPDLPARLLWMETDFVKFLRSVLPRATEPGIKAHLEQLEDDHNESIYLLKQRAQAQSNPARAKPNKWVSRGKEGGSQVISESTKIDGQRVVLSFFRNDDDAPGVWNAALLVGATRKAKDQMRRDASWKGQYDLRTTGKSGLKALNWASHKLDEFQKKYPGAGIFLEGTDEQRVKVYNRLKRKGFFSAQYAGLPGLYRPAGALGNPTVPSGRAEALLRTAPTKALPNGRRGRRNPRLAPEVRDQIRAGHHVGVPWSHSGAWIDPTGKLYLVDNHMNFADGQDNTILGLIRLGWVRVANAWNYQYSERAATPAAKHTAAHLAAYASYLRREDPERMPVYVDDIDAPISNPKAKRNLFSRSRDPYPLPEFLALWGDRALVEEFFSMMLSRRNPQIPPGWIIGKLESEGWEDVKVLSRDGRVATAEATRSFKRDGRWESVRVRFTVELRGDELVFRAQRNPPARKNGYMIRPHDLAREFGFEVVPVDGVYYRWLEEVRGAPPQDIAVMYVRKGRGPALRAATRKGYELWVDEDAEAPPSWVKAIPLSEWPGAKVNPKKKSLPKPRNVALQVHIEQRKGAGAGSHKSKAQRGSGKGSGKWGRHGKHKKDLRE